MPRQDPLPSSVLDNPACSPGPWPSIPNERSWALPLMCDTGAARESFEKSTRHRGLCGRRACADKGGRCGRFARHPPDGQPEIDRIGRR
jgi:hypothetical protein